MTQPKALKIILVTPWTLPGRQKVFQALRALGFDNMIGRRGYYATQTPGDEPESPECSIFVISEHWPLNEADLSDLRRLPEVQEIAPVAPKEVPASYQGED